MKATILVDNIAADNLTAEWGLCIYIEQGNKKILLDTGASDNFVKNAEQLGIDLSAVDFGVLSHAHYDHANGLDAFFAVNDHAKFYLRAGAGENCYHKYRFHYKYIGIKKGILEKYKDRIVFAEDRCVLAEGVELTPHTTENLRETGFHNKMYVKVGRKRIPDDFSHEQNLILETQKGLVIFNSCSHAGADNIIHETLKMYPDKKICALAGGFHLFRCSDEEVYAFVDRVKKTGIEKLYTGHCTGKRAYDILKQELGDVVEQLRTGLTIEF